MLVIKFKQEDAKKYGWEPYTNVKGWAPEEMLLLISEEENIICVETEEEGYGRHTWDKYEDEEVLINTLVMALQLLAEGKAEILREPEGCFKYG